MDRREADELVILATLTALALARGKDADELAVLAGFLVVVSDQLALIAAVLACQASAAEEAEDKKSGDDMAAKIAELEEQVKELKACCEKQANMRKHPPRRVLCLFSRLRGPARSPVP